MSIEYDRFWKIENGRFYEIKNWQENEIDTDYLNFPGTTTDLDLADFQNLNEYEIVNLILDQKGSWSVVYFDNSSKKLFIGRDIFGRQSLVLHPESMTFGCRVDPFIAGKWIEIPFGQVTVISTENVENEKLKCYKYSQNYPEDLDLAGFYDNAVFSDSLKKTKLLTVSREKLENIDAESEEPMKLIEKVKDATKVMFRKGVGSHIGVCLSGGVDSTFIAHIAHLSVPNETQIDLINVAFGEDLKACSQAPDRSRALLALKSLREKYPNRKFRLILVNVNSKELEKNRAMSISLAARPAQTVLDDSLSCVLWFAVRARGVDSDSESIEKAEVIESPAQTLLLGSGADELLAGYARHRTRFEKERIPENVAEECENELNRLGSRNGGRDARVAAQIGKTILSPLLEDDVVEYLNSLPVNAKWDLSLPRGIGEKKILREAVKSLGSPHDAPKQAMQFGSRMAKMSNQGDSNIKGSHKSPHLD